MVEKVWSEDRAEFVDQDKIEGNNGWSGEKLQGHCWKGYRTYDGGHGLISLYKNQ